MVRRTLKPSPFAPAGVPVRVALDEHQFDEETLLRLVDVENRRDGRSPSSVAHCLVDETEDVGAAQLEVTTLDRVDVVPLRLKRLLVGGGLRLAA